MKIGLQTWGSDGDINPFIALAGGLAAQGHDVTLAITAVERKDYSQYAERLKFHLAPVSYLANSDEELRRLSQQLDYMTKPLDQVRFIFQELFERNVDSLYNTAQRLAGDNELLIGHFILHPLQLAAEKTGKPYLTVTLNHSGIPSRYVSPPLMPKLGRWINPLTWKLAIGVLNRITLPSVNRLRVREGLAPVRSSRLVLESPLYNLIAVSPAFCTQQLDWGSNQQVCGFFRLPVEARPWTLPESLSQFLQAGEPPVYMTFGSMLGLGGDPAQNTQTTRLLVEAAKSAGCRAIIQSHWDSLSEIEEDLRIYRIGPTPHNLIFPYCVAVVHHGGAGTTQTALHHGLPSVIVAHIADQYFWAEELKRLGVAPKGLERRSATPSTIAQAIMQILGSPAMQNQAKLLGHQFAKENGVTKAVEIITRLRVMTDIKFSQADF